MRVNKPFTKLKRFIDKNPMRFDMGAWAKETDCGTSFCIAGFVLFTAGVPLEKYVYGNLHGMCRHEIKQKFYEIMRHSGYPDLNEDLVNEIIHLDDATAKHYVDTLAEYEKSGRKIDFHFQYTRQYPSPFVAFGIK